LVTEAVDVLWIATKTYQLETALRAVQATPICVVPLLNGVDHVAVLRSRFGRERVVPGTIAVEAEKAAAGRFVQRSPVVRFNLAASGEPRFGAIVAQLGKSRVCLQVHCKRADSVVGQALLPWTVCVGNIGIRHEYRRGACGRKLETEIAFCDRRSVCRGEREWRGIGCGAS
jgi:ketopantoate reductase